MKQILIVEDDSFLNKMLVGHSLSRSPGCSQPARAAREEFVIENLTKLAEHARSCGSIFLKLFAFWWFLI